MSISCFKFLVKPKINAQVSSAVGFELISVPETIIFLSLAAPKSIALFLIPLVTIYFNFFKFEIRFFVILVRSLIINKASKSFNFSIASSSFKKYSLKTLNSYFLESSFKFKKFCEIF